MKKTQAKLDETRFESLGDFTWGLLKELGMLADFENADWFAELTETDQIQLCDLIEA